MAPPAQQNVPSRRRTSSSSSSPSSSSASGARTRIIYRERLPSGSDLLPFWQRTWFLVLLLLMALAFFGLSIYLLFTLDLHHSSASPVYAASQGAEVSSLSPLFGFSEVFGKLFFCFFRTRQIGCSLFVILTMTSYPIQSVIPGKYACLWRFFQTKFCLYFYFYFFVIFWKRKTIS